MNSILKELYYISEAPLDIYGHSARKVQCWFYYDATKPGVIENKICEGTDCLKAASSSEQWYDKPTGYGCLSKKCELWVQ